MESSCNSRNCQFGDTYYCYKHIIAIIILGCVDSRGVFTCVNVGRPGSVCDSYTYRYSPLHQKLTSGEWLDHSPRQIGGCNVAPFVVAEVAFPLASNMMKCYEGTTFPRWQRSFNYSLIRTRCVVEQAFGRLKGQRKIVDKCNLNDPVFARRVAIVCCALHNVCERPFRRYLATRFVCLFQYHNSTSPLYCNHWLCYLCQRCCSYIYIIHALLLSNM